MNLKSIIVFCCGVSFLFSCAEKRAETESAFADTAAYVPVETSGSYAYAANDAKLADSDGSAKKSSNAFISSSAAVENGKDSTRKFIRTADLKFRVKDVIQSTYYIEDATKRFGGFVSYTNLSSSVNGVSTTEVSADSSLETTSYVVENNLVLRVPNTKLDTVLKTIAKSIDFLDYRIIKAEDVALQLLSNKLTQKRATRAEKRLTDAVDNNANVDLSATTYASDVAASKQEQADNAKVANLSLKDQIEFSTINIAIYQRKSVKQELIANGKSVDAYEPGFMYKFVAAIKSGWHILQAIVLGVMHFWAFILIGVVIYVVYRMSKLKSKK